MENPEEVLQALDEFQKLRPTEIPRELEEYLCWVAKTGDPVYQWTLIKALFREKLSRVMTDFYESCPSLELAPCPNVEHFNYDTMKSNLLERLESFANAPFTVQRICELLTAPRKEYNRVDKFMRAIEKNILVVSTREPGPAARRSENGDGMVNGSVEEDTPSTQHSHEVEMESWVKECTPANTIVADTAENESPLLDTVMPAATIIKNLPVSLTNLSGSLNKSEQTSLRPDAASSNFIPSTSDLSVATNLTSQITSEDSSTSNGVQNLSTMTHDTPGIVGDVPEAIMNEDTSSQPSLDLENNEGESTDSSKKLQTTFQARDFISTDAETTKPCSQNNLSTRIGNTDNVTDSNVGQLTSSGENRKDLSHLPVQNKMSIDNEESIHPMTENLLEVDKTLENKEVIQESTEHSGVSDSNSEDSSLGQNSLALVLEAAPSIENSLLTNKTSDTKVTLIEPSHLEDREMNEDSRTSTIAAISQENKMESKLDVDENILVSAKAVKLDLEEHNLMKEQPRDAKENLDVITENSKPVVEEPGSEFGQVTNQHRKKNEEDTVTIEETIADNVRVTKSIVPDPIPIIEEPKEAEQDNKKTGGTELVVEVSEDFKEETVIVKDQPAAEETKSMIVESAESVENMKDAKKNIEGVENIEIVGQSQAFEHNSQNKSAACLTKNDEAAESNGSVSVKGTGQVESMEVDNEESVLTFRQDEPMEQETTDSFKS
ncbi:serine/threonine-protein phosphatase 4 regulatory subunit 2-like [Cephus cinctus]|uniref:Serine/threonine-protein phosphatase 4 regulatory subunit 2-like n=1 Tax=Cephus cinctus TaxID=211228 RepID=A0AAJ7BJJ7_CEPCN|nr:serine/threonine-protein phosphatase 4 regulatory subunit 2-like [Cephus cinctus]